MDTQGLEDLSATVRRTDYLGDQENIQHIQLKTADTLPETLQSLSEPKENTKDTKDSQGIIPTAALVLTPGGGYGYPNTIDPNSRSGFTEDLLQKAGIKVAHLETQERSAANLANFVRLVNNAGIDPDTGEVIGITDIPFLGIDYLFLTNANTPNPPTAKTSSTLHKMISHQ